MDAEEGASVRLSIRFSPTEAKELSERAQRAGLSRGVYLGELMASAESPLDATERSARFDTVVASNAEVATLSRNIRRLAALLGQGSVHEAKQYRAMLDTLNSDVRRHLARTSELANELPQARHAVRSVRRTAASLPGEGP